METVTPLWTDYDEEMDIFYIKLREPDVQAPRTYEVGGGVLIDRDPASKEIIGIEILDFLGNFTVMRDLSWLRAVGIPDEVLTFLQETGRDMLKNRATPDLFSDSSRQ